MLKAFRRSLQSCKKSSCTNKKVSIDKIELCGAVLSKRLKSFIDKECKYTFEKCYYVVDSKIVHAMIQKSSYGFNTFAATRIDEIQGGTNIEDWYWCESRFNIADWLTRRKKPSEISLHSDWQEGPLFLKQPESEWPISRNYSEVRIPKTIMKVVNTVNVSVKDDLGSRIKNATQEITSKDVETAEVFWIKEAQRNMKNDIKHGTYRRLCPRVITR